VGGAERRGGGVRFGRGGWGMFWWGRGKGVWVGVGGGNEGWEEGWGGSGGS